MTHTTCAVLAVQFATLDQACVTLFSLLNGDVIHDVFDQLHPVCSFLLPACMSACLPCSCDPCFPSPLCSCYLCFTLQQHPVVSRIYIYSFISLFIYAVLNIFIAIIEDAFFASKAVRSRPRGHCTL